jgi:hypothetical protein
MAWAFLSNKTASVAEEIAPSRQLNPFVAWKNFT